MRRLSLPIFLLAAAILTGLSCAGSGPEKQVGLLPGELGIFVSDAPPDPSIRAVWIDVTKIEANLGGYPVSLPVKVESLNLLDHVDVPAFVAAAAVSSGEYSQIKLHVSRVTVEDADGTHEAVIPAHLRDGVPIDFRFTVHAEHKNDVLLDFNVGRSIVKGGPGQYTFQPSILSVIRSQTGVVYGKVRSGYEPVAFARIQAFREGEPHFPTNETYSRPDGRFRLWGMQPGTYRVEAMEFDRFGVAISGRVETGIRVEAGDEVNLGRLRLTDY